MIKKILAASAFLFLSGCIENGDGEKRGNIVKLAQEGLICTTWEAELIKGGFNGGSGTMGQKFDFTVSDLSLVDKLQKALDNGKEVKIHYKQEAFVFPCRGETSNFLQSIEEIQ